MPFYILFCLPYLKYMHKPSLFSTMLFYIKIDLYRFAEIFSKNKSLIFKKILEFDCRVSVKVNWMQL